MEDQNQDPQQPQTPAQPGFNPTASQTAPDYAAQPAPQNPPGQQATPSQQPAAAGQGGTDVMGIISIVMAFIGFSLIGLIIGLVGASKAKKEGRSPTLSRIGWILNLVFTVVIGLILIFTIFLAAPRLQEASRDTARHSDLARISSALETYYDINGYYPPNLAAITDPPIPTADTSGKPYEYRPEPAGCTRCTSYTLQSSLESGETKSIDSLRPERGRTNQ